MSQSKMKCPQESNPRVFAASSVYNTPVLTERFDRFCSNCSAIIENLALEKFPNQRCNRCSHEVEFIDKPDGIYRRCVRCFVFVRCSSKFCYMCGRNNQYLDPEKPERLAQAQVAQIRERVKQELQEKNESLALSQSCLNDGEFDDESNTEAVSVTKPVDASNN